jgi:lysophospholipase L1-like esterase
MKVSQRSGRRSQPGSANFCGVLLNRIVCAILFAGLVLLTGCGAPFSNVFMGDSITAFWSVPGMNLGVPGNTTTEMLARYPAEVPRRGFHTFILLGGTNDIRYFVANDEVVANIAKMASDARTEGMNVVLCELPPIYEDRFKHDPTVRALNASIRQLAEAQHYYLVDYYDPMIGHPEYFKDQLHPNAKGYDAMDAALVPVLKAIKGT